MKSTTSLPAASLRNIRGILLGSLLLALPVSAFAQRGGAAAHGAVAHPAAAGRPAVHMPPPAARPATGTAVRPIISGPGVMRPMGSAPMPTRPMITRPGIAPIVPFRPPITSAGMFLPSRPPHRFPPTFGVTALPGSAAFFAYNPFLLRSCGAFVGFAYGCGVLPPFFGFGYNPAVLYPTIYPTDSGYPSAPYPSEPTNPPDPFATLQYTPLLNQPLPQGLPAEDLNLIGGTKASTGNETLLYLKDGSVFAVASYTVSEGRLHYVTAYGDRSDILVDDLDVQKTIQANAALGVAFTLTPAPVAAGDSKPTPLGPTPAPDGPITPAK